MASPEARLKRRIQSELSELNNDPTLDGQMKVELLNDSNMLKLKGTFKGPPQTPYADGSFITLFDLSSNYPFKPPAVTFQTRVWHPNVSDRGYICVDLLRSRWTPASTLKVVLLSLQLLMQDPNPNSPLVSYHHWNDELQ